VKGSAVQRHKISLIVLTVISAPHGAAGCGPKDDIDTSEGSSETGPTVDGAWALGRHYQPAQVTTATSEMPSMEIMSDFTARLDLTYCRDDAMSSQTVGWKVIDADTIEFFGLNGEEKFWFFSKPYARIRMRSTADPEIVIVDDDGNETGLTLGKFRRGVGCLRFTDETMGCFGGAFVYPCEG
jgi:hypothetical protein